MMSYGLSIPFNADAVQLAELAAALAKAMPREHHGFLNHLLLSFGCGDFFFVHAGVGPGVALRHQREKICSGFAMNFSNTRRDTKKSLSTLIRRLRDPKSGSIESISTPAYATGRLTCLILEADQMWFI